MKPTGKSERGFFSSHTLDNNRWASWDLLFQAVCPVPFPKDVFSMFLDYTCLFGKNLAQGLALKDPYLWISFDHIAVLNTPE